MGGKFGIGDRLEVDDARGDVIDIQLLRTTLLEINGWPTLVDSGITFSLFYVAHYRGCSTIRNRINRRLIAELESRPHIQLAYHTLNLLHAPNTPGMPSAVLGSENTGKPFPATATSVEAGMGIPPEETVATAVTMRSTKATRHPA